VNSENVYSAFFALLSSVPGFTTYSRRLVMVEDCDATQMPALYMKCTTEKMFARSNDGVEAWDLEVDIFIYTNAPDLTTPAAPIFNPLKDSIVNSLAPSTLPLPSTQAGVQYNPFLSGPVLSFENWLGQKSVVHIPVTIRAPDNA
jgi:hypothetical protein